MTSFPSEEYYQYTLESESTWWQVYFTTKDTPTRPYGYWCWKVPKHVLQKWAASSSESDQRHTRMVTLFKKWSSDPRRWFPVPGDNPPACYVLGVLTPLSMGSVG